MLVYPTLGQPQHGSLKRILATTQAVAVDRELHAGLASLSEQLAWHDGAVLTGINVKEDGEGFFVILKATSQGKPVVHFTGGRTFFDAVEAILWEVQHGLLNWRPDRYASGWGKQTLR